MPEFEQRKSAPARSDCEPVVRLRDVRHSYRGVAALQQLHLDVPAGEITALLGPNGAGKTTTVELCEGLQRPESGHVQVLGLDPLRHNRALRSRLGVMPQGGGAYPGVRAAEMLHLVARCARNPQNPEWLLEVLGLQSVSGTPYKRLSGGQQQRLSLACALVTRPELVFLDEPTTGLDPQARRLVWQLVQSLRRDGVTVLLTTHMMDEAEQLADSVVILDQGAVVASGSPKELTTDHDGGRLRFRAKRGLDLHLLQTALPETLHPEETAPGHYQVHGPIDPQVVSTVTAWCAQQGVMAEDLRVARRSLEDVFLELTGKELRG